MRRLSVLFLFAVLATGSVPAAAAGPRSEAQKAEAFEELGLLARQRLPRLLRAVFPVNRRGLPVLKSEGRGVLSMELVLQIDLPSYEAWVADASPHLRTLASAYRPVLLTRIDRGYRIEAPGREFAADQFFVVDGFSEAPARLVAHVYEFDLATAERVRNLFRENTRDPDKPALQVSFWSPSGPVASTVQSFWPSEHPGGLAPFIGWSLFYGRSGSGAAAATYPIIRFDASRKLPLRNLRVDPAALGSLSSAQTTFLSPSARASLASVDWPSVLALAPAGKADGPLSVRSAGAYPVDGGLRLFATVYESRRPWLLWEALAPAGGGVPDPATQTLRTIEDGRLVYPDVDPSAPKKAPPPPPPRAEGDPQELRAAARRDFLPLFEQAPEAFLLSVGEGGSLRCVPDPARYRAWSMRFASSLRLQGARERVPGPSDEPGATEIAFGPARPADQGRGFSLDPHSWEGLLDALRDADSPFCRLRVRRADGASETLAFPLSADWSVRKGPLPPFPGFFSDLAEKSSAAPFLKDGDTVSEAALVPLKTLAGDAAQQPVLRAASAFFESVRTGKQGDEARNAVEDYTADNLSASCQRAMRPVSGGGEVLAEGDVYLSSLAWAHWKCRGVLDPAAPGGVRLDEPSFSLVRSFRPPSATQRASDVSDPFPNGVSGLVEEAQPEEEASSSAPAVLLSLFSAVVLGGTGYLFFLDFRRRREARRREAERPTFSDIRSEK